MDIFTSPIILIAAGLILVLLGIGAGMLISSLNEDSEPEEEGAEQVPPGGQKGRYQPVARLWRDQKSGSMLVEMQGKSFVSAGGMSADLRSKLESAARDLRVWLGMGLNTPLEAPQVSRSENRSGVERVASTPTASPGIAQGAPAAPTRIETTPGVGPVPYPAASTPANEIDDEVVFGSPQKSIVMQIEDILQDMLAGTEMAQKGVHLIEDPVKGVIVRIGLSHYEGIESVPDPQIKQTIRAAVAEWEKTQ